MKINVIARSGHVAKVCLILWGCCVWSLMALADSDRNGYVTVSCDAPRVRVVADGDDFNVFAPGYPVTFVTNVMVSAHDGWELVKPRDYELPLKMQGGDVETYEVVRSPEGSAGGTIYFHNYCIESDREDGAKDIIVEAGARVIYTAYKNGSQCTSDWTVNGATRNSTAHIILNRDWWYVPGWFIPSMDTPKPGIYDIYAHDTQYPVLDDSGCMTVVGIKSISGNGKYSTKENSNSFTTAETIVVKKGGTVALTATPDPNMTWPDGWPTWDASCGFWCLGNHFVGGTAGKSTVDVDTSSPDSIVVTASCGESEKCIKVVAYELGLSVSKSNLTLKHDCDTVFTVAANPSSEFSTPMIQVKRNDIGASRWPDWMDLKDGRGIIDWKARVAGIFKLRARALIAGEECLSDEKDMTVEFPTYDQITADGTVRAAMDNEWQATLVDCTQNPNQRRERGFWVLLDTSGEGAYSSGSVYLGQFFGPLDGASVDLDVRPLSKLSDVAPNAQTASYAVSSFHSHTPTTYRQFGRDSGPSPADLRADVLDNVAGIVYDYTVNFIPAGHPKNAQADIYKSRNRRNITAE